MNEEIIQKYKVKKDLPWGFFGAFHTNATAYLQAAFDGTIKAGEICSYAGADKKYGYADIYLFIPKDGVTAFVRRKIVERWAEYFEPVTTEGTENTEKEGVQV